ncbi:MAG: hypothetical protein ACREAA_18935 [Candidatus Polarisedimenticolia bacterium]
MSALDTLHFGVGCFSLAHRRTGSSLLRPSGYAALFRDLLNTLPAASNIVINTDSSDEPRQFTVQDHTSLKGGELSNAALVLFSCQFDLHIPERIQNELSPLGSLPGSDHFRVHIKHTYLGPVCFVRLLLPYGPPDPSTGVVVVRKYLSQEISRLGSKFAFDFLEPSPFPAGFSLSMFPSEKPGAGHRFQADCVRPRGYASIAFRRDSRPDTDPDDALNELFQELVDELSLYYHIVRGNVSAFRMWEGLQKQVVALLESTRHGGPMSRIRRMGRGSGAIYDLQTALVEFEASEIFRKEQGAQRVRQVYGLSSPTYLRVFIDDAMSESPTYPLSGVKSLLEFLEGRRSKAMELLILMLSALIGGLAGAVITAALQG